MARIRTIKPEFWTDEKVVQLPYQARLLFIGLWNFADDEGYLWDEPSRIKLQVLPADDIDPEMLIDLLIASGLLESLETESGKKVLKIINFTEHQKVSNPTPSKISREKSRKLAIPNEVRRMVAKKYGCSPGEEKDVECFYCGAPGRIHWWRLYSGKPGAWVTFSLELDHLVAEGDGGETTEKNLVLACRECNRRKATKSFSDFLNKTTENSRKISQEGNGREGKGRESKERESGEDQSEIVDKIAHEYPGNEHLKGKPIPYIQQNAILEAVIRDGADLVLAGTRNYRDAVAGWSPTERRFIVGVDKFYGPESHYLKNPVEWQRNGNSKTRNRSEEAIEAIRGTDDADFDAMAARQAQSQGVPR